MSDYFEAEILPLFGLNEEQKPIKRAKSCKMQCCKCGHIAERLTCPKCNNAMFKYIDRIGK